MNCFKLVLLFSIVFLIVSIVWCGFVKILPSTTYYNGDKVEYCVDTGYGVEYKDLDGVVYVENTGECSYMGE